MGNYTRTISGERDIKTLAKTIRDQDGTKYTEALRQAKRISEATEAGYLDLFWSKKNHGNVNGALAPHECVGWSELLFALNESDDMPDTAIWSLVNTGPGWNQLLLNPSLGDPYENTMLYVQILTDVEAASLRKSFLEEFGEEDLSLEDIFDNETWVSGPLEGTAILIRAYSDDGLEDEILNEAGISQESLVAYLSAFAKKAVQ